MAQADFDVAIIGGGPGGSAAATYLAKAGIKCVLMERELFPRPHVGESLVPASNRVLADLGVIDQMDEHFVRKLGAVWTSSSNAPQYKHGWDEFGEAFDAGEADIRFEERAQPGVTHKWTWHVDRGAFDLMLLQHANKQGAAIYEGIRVQGVDFSDPKLPRVKFTVGRQERAIAARVIIDASGRHTLLGNQLRLKQQDLVFNQYATHTWFQDFNRKAAATKDTFGDYIFVHFLPLTNSWIWQIPITENVTSIGVVTQRKNFEKTRQSREEFFWDSLKARPELFDALKASQQLRPLKEEGDYSYSMSRIRGEGFVMIGDAARFVDPIFSSGVSIALNCAKLASRDILAALNNGGISPATFDTYEATVRRGTRNWYEFISLYYRLNVLFTFFVQDKRYRIEVLKLLQGDMYDEERPAVLNEMARVVADVERRPSHPWHKYLGEMTGDVFKPLY